MDKEITSKLLAEFVGSCFLVMIVVGSGIMAENLSSNELNVLLANTIATGAGLTALILIFIAISGAHFNPAVTLARGFSNTFTGIDPNYILPFICAQLLGAYISLKVMNFLQE